MTTPTLTDLNKDAKALHRSSEEIRDLIITWMERNREVPVTPNHNWRIVP